MLMSFESAHKVSSVCKALVSSCVKPRESLTEKFDVKFTALKIDFVEVSNFQLAAF